MPLRSVVVTRLWGKPDCRWKVLKTHVCVLLFQSETESESWSESEMTSDATKVSERVKF